MSLLTVGKILVDIFYSVYERQQLVVRETTKRGL